MSKALRHMRRSCLWLLLYLVILPATWAEDCITSHTHQYETCLLREGWQRIELRDGIEKFTRRKAGKDLYELLAVITFNVPAAKLQSIISDYESYPSFMPYVEASQVLHVEDGVSWVFQQLHFPWPVSDRYHTIRLWQQPEGNNIRISWSLANDAEFIRKGHGVATKLNSGFWYLVPLGSGAQTLAFYSVYTNPGSPLPDWVIDRANRQAVSEVLNALRERAQGSRSDDPFRGPFG